MQVFLVIAMQRVDFKKSIIAVTGFSTAYTQNLCHTISES